MMRVPFGQRLQMAATLLCVAMLTSCGGGGDVVVVVPPPPDHLWIDLTRVGPEAIQVDWSDDPYVDSFTVYRDGYALANVTSTTTLIDASVLIGDGYCYDVSGYDAAGVLIAASDQACITVFP